MTGRWRLFSTNDSASGRGCAFAGSLCSVLEPQEVLPRLLDRQTSRGCHHVQTVILRLLCLECHGGLRCCRLGTRHPPSAGLRQQRRNRSMLNLECADCKHETPDPGNTQESGTAKIKKRSTFQAEIGNVESHSSGRSSRAISRTIGIASAASIPGFSRGSYRIRRSSSSW